MHARRVEANIKADWNLVPSQRNLTTKWDARQNVKNALRILSATSKCHQHHGTYLKMPSMPYAITPILEKEAAGAKVATICWKQPARLMQRKNDQDVIVELPGYDLRKDATTSDPAAVMEAFKINIRFILPRIFGYRMCPLCPLS